MGIALLKDIRGGAGLGTSNDKSRGDHVMANSKPQAALVDNDDISVSAMQAQVRRQIFVEHLPPVWLLHYKSMSIFLAQMEMEHDHGSNTTQECSQSMRFSRRASSENSQEIPGKPSFFAISIGLLLSFLVVMPLSAATPLSSFGVSATVQAGCSVSTATFYGANATIVKNAKSIISITCTNSAQYSVYVSTDIRQGESSTNQFLYNSSLAVNGMYSGSIHDVNPGRMLGNLPGVRNGSLFSQPFLSDGQPWRVPSIKPGGNTDAIVVAVIY